MKITEKQMKIYYNDFQGIWFSSGPNFLEEQMKITEKHENNKLKRNKTTQMIHNKLQRKRKGKNSE